MQKKTRRALILWFALPLVCYVSAISAGQQKQLEWGQADLVGMDKIKLFIFIEQKAIKNKTLQDTIVSDVESQLRKAGIHIATDAEEHQSNKEGNPTPMLSITVGFTPVKHTSLFSYITLVSLDQFCTQMRKNSAMGTYPVWERSDHGAINSNDTQEIRSSVKYYVGRFIHDYTAANPKK